MEGASPDAPKIFGRAEAQSSKLLLMHQKNFRQCRSTALQKSHSPFANRQSLFAAVSARQEPRPPIFASSLVPRPTTCFKSVSMVTKPAEAG
jgi:hypothetical protein